MKKQMKGSSRVLSFVLALCLIVGMLPMMAPTADAAYHTDNAPAASAYTLASTQDTYAATSGGGMLRIINGDLYVWGSNYHFGLGYEGLKDGYLESPTIHSHNSKFRENGDSVKKVITSYDNGVTILTEQNRIFSWGWNFNYWVFDPVRGGTNDGVDVSPDDGATPVEWDTTALGGEDIEEIYSSTLGISVKTTSGKWFIAGTSRDIYFVYNMADNRNTTDIMELKPVSESFIDKMQPSYVRGEENDGSGTVENEAERYDAEEKTNGEARHTIKKVIPSYGGGSCFIIMQAPDGTETLWSLGVNNHGQNLMPDVFNATSGTWEDPDNPGKYFSNHGQSSIYPVEVLTHSQNKALADAKPDLSTLNSNGVNTTFIDAEGSVWMAGDIRDAFYDSSVNFHRPQKVYDAKNNGSRAVKSYQADRVVVFLTEDNSLYAIGANQNNFISPANVTYVHKYTQVFTSLSQSQTIAGVYPTDKGVMVVTESGEQFFSGDNSLGTAGNGTTESPTSGSYMESVSPTTSPVQPTSANQISFDIEDEDGNRYASDIYIDPEEPDAEPEYRIKVTDINGNVTYKAENELNFMAGKKIKLNVYFEDFAKISQFIVPIKFDNNSVKVINGHGDEYSSASIVTPGAIGASVGITQGFTNETWQGGILTGESGLYGTYPKIANGEGWVAVHGYSPTSGRIKEKQLMFSIDFMVVGQASGETFEIYDEAKHNDLVMGAAWLVTPGANSTADPGVFAFNYAPAEDYFFPSYSAEIKPLESIELKIESSAGNKIEEVEETVTTTADGETKKKGYGLSWDNTNEVYTIYVDPAPDEASFPQVTWTTPFTLVNDPNDGVTEADNYLTIVEQGSTYIKVKVPETVRKEAPGVIEIHATSVKDTTSGTKATAYITIIVTNFAPPTSIEIAEKASLSNGTMIYTRTDDDKKPDEIKTFTAVFPDNDEDPTFNKIQVTWKLLDKNGNELTDKNTNNPVEIVSTIAGSGAPSDTGHIRPSATVQPLKTTYGEDYVILRVESMYDPSIYDEIIIKVQLEATKLSFSQTILRMPAGTSKDLRPLLQISPADYYAVDLEWSFAPPKGKNSFIIFNNSSVITAGSNPTNAVNPGESGSLQDVYDTVTVRDRISGEPATIYIEVLDLNSPIMPEDVNVVNVLGPKGDYVEVKDGLQVGDVIRFYKTYDTPKPDESVSDDEKNKVMREFPITELAQTPRFNFTLNDFLESDGGEIAMTVERDGAEMHRVPLTYNPEPSKVYGYVRLSGKNGNSARNEGIQVLLSDGVSNPDPVYTDRTGRFEFTTYIVPGTYTLTIYQDNYLKRNIKADTAAGYAGLVIPTAAEFAISTAEDPILLYPGDVNADGAINTTDLNYYVRNWVGQTSTSLKDFAKFDFYDGAQQVVDLLDLDLVLRRLGWVRENYAKWYVPTQK